MLLSGYQLPQADQGSPTELAGGMGTFISMWFRFITDLHLPQRIKEGVVQADTNGPDAQRAEGASGKKKGRGVTTPEKVAEAASALLTTSNETTYSRRFNLATLQALCENRGLSVEGDKIDLAHRLFVSVSRSYSKLRPRNSQVN